EGESNRTTAWKGKAGRSCPKSKIRSVKGRDEHSDKIGSSRAPDLCTSLAQAHHGPSQFVRWSQTGFALNVGPQEQCDAQPLPLTYRETSQQHSRRSR